MELNPVYDVEDSHLRRLEGWFKLDHFQLDGWLFTGGNV